MRTEREVSGDISWDTVQLKSRVQKGRKSYFAIVYTIAMRRHGWIYMTNKIPGQQVGSCSMAMSQTLSLGAE